MVKGTADYGALTHSGQGEGEVWMRGKPAVTDASMTLQQPEAQHVFSWGSCPWITGPLQWRVPHGLRRGGVDSDLCLYAGFLVAAAAALAFHAHLWCPS